MAVERTSGILLHITSLPSKYGIGDLGKEAYDFVDFLSRSFQKLWQVLPLGPVGYGESPYQAFSAFAGNPMLISIDQLVSEGLLDFEEVREVPWFEKEKVDYQQVSNYKNRLLKRAFEKFKEKSISKTYIKFVRENNYWLEEYALFMALKTYFNQLPWYQWEDKIAFRKEEALKFYKKHLEEDISYEKFVQFKFYNQWMKLRKYANYKSIKIIGDMPLFVSYDSCDVWSKGELFRLNSEGKPISVAGVPPDYFSKEGQLWGNPHYNWNRIKEQEYGWWIERIRWCLKQFDFLRLDHFRGIESYWEIPGEARNAVEGRWTKGPGETLFQFLKKALGELPFIVEDLGIITEEVIQLREKLGFPGMRVLQFTLLDANSADYNPKNFDKNSVVYTGTHDNDTILGWYETLQKEIMKNLDKEYGINDLMEGNEIVWKLIKLAFESTSQMAIIPLQDILCLGSEGRMNKPGIVGDNWRWRFREEALTDVIEGRLRKLSIVVNRNL